ncbi:MAG: DHH family phosphoesterase [Bacteroidetes bacterium]|nr:DHH family phosphoesterase [Bacteroidota bacterium]
MKPLHELVDILSSPKKIIITHHNNPDADALGSSLGLYHYLTQKGHSCQVVSPNTIPDFILWMPASENVLIYEKSRVEVDILLQNTDLVFSLDYNHNSRTHSMEATLDAFQGVKVLIDHHLQPDTRFHYGNSNAGKSSTCEMVYDFILENKDEDLITLDISQCLYAGLMTDTGSFKFPCTTESVHAMAAGLMLRGLEPASIHTKIFDTFEEGRLRFLGFVLSEKMKINTDLHAAIIPVSMEELNRFQLKTGDTEGIVNYPLSIKEVIFSTFISERENEIRMSFRSKGSFDVNQFARTYFNGGGHANAAGGRSKMSLQQTIEIYNKAISENEIKLKQCYEELV